MKMKARDKFICFCSMLAVAFLGYGVFAHHYQAHSLEHKELIKYQERVNYLSEALEQCSHAH